eukprot:CCRYP_014269-RA/>CCRYP_014269-RA protein AED:0.19 eAED:0.19 QI:0/-1/0/1/-1/1/1/0/191
MAKKILVTPCHHNYPSDPDEPRLLIPPQEHRGRGILPVIWDPKRPSSPMREANASAAQGQAQVKVDATSSHGIGRPGFTDKRVASDVTHFPTTIQSADLHHLNPSRFCFQGPKFVQPEGHHSSSAAFQLMMYLNHPSFLTPIPSPQPMSCYFEFGEYFSIEAFENALGSGYDFEPEVPYSSGFFKHTSGDH